MHDFTMNIISTQFQFSVVRIIVYKPCQHIVVFLLETELNGAKKISADVFEITSLNILCKGLFFRGGIQKNCLINEIAERSFLRGIFVKSLG